MNKRKAVTICNKCKSMYELAFVRTLFPLQHSIDCEVCGEKLQTWVGPLACTIELIERHEDHLQAS